MTPIRIDMSTWKTQEGQVLEIKDMDDRHLINSINMVKRRLAIQMSTVIKDLKLLASHHKPRAASFDNDVKTFMVSALASDRKLPILLKEAERRNLST